MIPDNEESTIQVEGDFLYPDNIVPRELYEDYELAGIAVQDPSEGLQYQVWKAAWDPSTLEIVLTSEKTLARHVLFTGVEVKELSVSFDQNMRWVLAVRYKDGSFLLHWYDSAVESYVATPLGGIATFKLSHDDKRPEAALLGWSDVILTYIDNNKLYVRNQRDRYGIAHLINADMPSAVIITNFGMTAQNRMQWKMRPRLPREIL